MQQQISTTPKKQLPYCPLGESQLPEQNPPPVVRTSRRKKDSTLQDDDNMKMTSATVEDKDSDGAPQAVKKAKKPSEIVMENFAYALARKKIDGLKAEFRELQAFKPPDTIATAFAANKNKNRYQNVPCYDKTRVILTHNVPPESDYVNANWISSALVNLTSKYICTQGPIEATVNDFWRMIWQEKVKNIVMLCGVVENGKQKCAQYFPVGLGESKLYGTILVTNKKNATAPSEKVYESTVFEVQAEGFAEPISLTLMRWVDWPDFGIPQSGMGMLRILKTIRENKDSTAVIHCSAGIGRTGTVMACEICVRILLDGKELNVQEVVKELRCQRAGSIQTESQYIYLHRALSEYVHAKKLVKEELVKFFMAFAEYRKTLVKPTENPPAVPVVPVVPVACPPQQQPQGACPKPI